MKHEALYQLVCLAYAVIIRPLIKRAVDDPDEEWDDVLLNVLDKLFNYKGDE